jgi:hypothetical protein
VPDVSLQSPNAALQLPYVSLQTSNVNVQSLIVSIVFELFYMKINSLSPLYSISYGK